jgi:hypothetical protein
MSVVKSSNKSDFKDNYYKIIIPFFFPLGKALPAEVAQGHKSLLGCQDLQQSPPLGQVFHLSLPAPFPANLSSVLLNSK